MPATYTLIASNTLSSSAASVTFSSIPATYTDLVLRFSARGTTTNTTVAFRFNGETGSTTTYSNTRLVGSGSTSTSGIGSDQDALIFGVMDGTSQTSDTFHSQEIYIPSYTASQNKPIAGFSAQENNATAADIRAMAGLWRNTAAINQITVFATYTNGSNLFASGSSFFLYGIKNT